MKGLYDAYYCEKCGRSGEPVKLSGGYHARLCPDHLNEWDRYAGKHRTFSTLQDLENMVFNGPIPQWAKQMQSRLRDMMFKVAMRWVLGGERWDSLEGMTEGESDAKTDG